MSTARELARMAGLKTYCTGHECKRGHSAPRRVSDRGCVECERLKKAAAAPLKRDAERDRARRYRAANPEVARASTKAWRARNPTAATEARKRWEAADPERQRIRTRNRRARIIGVGGSITAGEISALTAAQGGRCAYCAKKTKLTLDHVMPLAKRGPHTIRNSQMLCMPCNQKKGAKHPLEFAQSIGLLL